MEALPAFQNEPYTDFSAPRNRRPMDEALASVRAQLGREYDLRIAGERLQTGDLLRSVNPSNPREVIGVHHRATAELARRAVDSAYAYFSEWSATPPAERIHLLVRAAAIIRRRIGRPVLMQRAAQFGGGLAACPAQRHPQRGRHAHRGEDRVRGIVRQRAVQVGAERAVRRRDRSLRVPRGWFGRHGF